MAFAVRTADKGLSVYRVPADGGPEEVGKWRGVSHVLVGDFANLSRDQLLIVFNKSEWIMTKMVCLNWVGNFLMLQPSMRYRSSLSLI